MTESDWLKEQFPPDFKGYACELGAHDGIHKSNTLLLEQAGWEVLCIEPNPRHHAALKANRKLTLFCACDREPGWSDLRESGVTPDFTYSTIREHEERVPVVAHVPVLTLDQCLAVVGFPRLDVLTLDVDGIELDILRGFTVERWKPHALVVEIVTGGHWIAAASEGSVTDWITDRGYRLVTRGGDFNHGFLRDW